MQVLLLQIGSNNGFVQFGHFVKNEDQDHTPMTRGAIFLQIYHYHYARMPSTFHSTLIRRLADMTERDLCHVFPVIYEKH